MIPVHVQPPVGTEAVKDRKPELVADLPDDADRELALVVRVPNCVIEQLRKIAIAIALPHLLGGQRLTGVIQLGLTGSDMRDLALDSSGLSAHPQR